MKLAYLTNQYPAVSLSFIRREILALENLGFEIMRVSIRSPGAIVGSAIDSLDQLEVTETIVILDQSRLILVASAIFEALTHFNRFLKTFGLTICLGLRSEKGLLWHIFYLIEALVLVRLCRKAKIEHIHVHFGTNPATVAMLVNAHSDLPYSFTVHGPDEFDRPEGIYLGEKIRRSSFVVAVSAYGRSQLMRWVDMADWDKIKIVHCGIDQSFSAADVTKVPDNRRLVSVSRLAPQKGLPVLIEACGILKKRDVQFEMVLVGDGELRPQIEAQVELLGLDNDVRITGWCTSDQVRQEINSARAFVLGSFAEGLPVVIMEAMALGRPVIATHIAGIPELVQSGINGWLVPPGDAEALADAMQDAFEIPTSEVDKLGKAGRKRVLERHNVITEARKLRELILTRER